MLEAIFSEGITTVTVTGLTQWDYGRKLTIKGLSYTDNVEVHFSNNIEKEAVVMEVTKSGSDLVTEVPNVLLEKNHDITAWVYIDSGTSGETVRTINLKVKPRIKPADYISENNAKEIIDYVDEAKELLENATEQADRLDEIVDRVPDFDSYEKLAEHDHLLYDGLYVSGETYSGIASNKGIKLHKVVGKTEQDGEPSPDSEVPIENIEIAEIKSTGKNLIPFPYDIGGVGSKNTTNGINFEVMPDKGVKLSGTATESAHINICVIDFGDTNFLSSTMNATNGYHATLVGNKTGLFLGYNGTNKRTSISINKGVAVNETVYPMIEKSDVKTEWEEPKGYATVETSLTLAEGDVFENGVITRKMKEANVTRDFAFSLQGTYENTLRFDSQYLTDKKSTSGKGYCNLLPKGSDSDNGDYEHFRFSSANKGFLIFINKSRLETHDVSGLAKYLDTAGMKLLYELDVPTTEEFKVPTIPSYYPFTNVSTDCNLETEIQYEILANSDNSLYQEELEKRIEALEHAMLER